MIRVLRHLWLVWALSFFSSCAARPPHEAGPFRPGELVELTRLDPTIRLDIRYATSHNFMGRVLYPQARAFLQRPAAEALVRVNAELKPLGYCLLVFDGYRPWRITKQMWDHTPADKKEFVADPRKGSRHNRGCAVDLSLWDIAANQEVAMPGEYDEMSPRSYATYAGGTTEQRSRRDLLRSVMERNGFTVLPAEWWHFDYQDWKSYPIEDVPFEKL
ncbi:M15 family metallopeptidase [Microvirga sp. STS02]|uniref:M15 family metallopeptidase n=1 Tax=Hymenobacter negativus TaxID=2795026 RepID=UPI0018DD827B|nr:MULTISPECIES: M15 family metallopeptidase [Bacteria]MBH8568160.1 M15 family metallopeptidase [Hymenobacter negativus]MBR7207895.1 M15 family metallopeptidase [Microvirga sp. STS02]